MKTIKFITVVFFVLASVGVFAQIEEVVTLDTGSGKLEGTLALKLDGSAKIPVALIIAGSGPTDRNGNNPMMTNNSLKMLADSLAQHGIASLRYDKRGIGASKAAASKEEDLRFETYVDDAVKWVEYLKWDERFDKIIVIGHSEGSLIGMLASEKAEVDKFISIAGVAEPAAIIIEKQLKVQPPSILSQAKPILEKLVKGEKVDSIPPILSTLFRPSVQPYLVSWFKYDPAKELAKLNIPVLIVQGTTDIQVDAENATKLSEVAKDGKSLVLEGMNHVLKEAPADRALNIQTYTKPDLALHSGLVEPVVDFIVTDR